MHFRKSILTIAGVSTISLLAACNSTTSEDAQAPSAAEEVAATKADTTAETAEMTDATILQLDKVDTIPTKPDDSLMGFSDTKFMTGITGHFIMTKVRYGGGCKDHEFSAFWDGSWEKSQPAAMSITIRHNANNDNCKAIKEQLLQINIGDVVVENPNFFVTVTDGTTSSERVEVSLK